MIRLLVLVVVVGGCKSDEPPRPPPPPPLREPDAALREPLWAISKSLVRCEGRALDSP